MGDHSLAETAGITYDEAVEGSKKLFNIFSGLKKYIDEKSNYCINNNGNVDTVLKDKMSMSDEPKDRWGRLGINTLIQGFSATALACGFHNLIVQGRIHNINIVPWLVVHDSCTKYFPIKDIFEIGEFYKEHFTQYLYKMLGILWEFDIEMGNNYGDRFEFKNIDKDTLQFSGNYISINPVLQKMKKELNITIKYMKSDEEISESNFLPKFGTGIVSDFMKKTGSPTYDVDYSKYKLIITRHL